MSLIATSALAPLASAAAPRNVILMIGDGMGHTEVQTTAYLVGHPLIMNTLPIAGVMSNNPSDDICTDSAAAATAMATGFKTNNGEISMTPKKVPLPTILELAQRAGKATGLVVRSTMTDATPAGFGAHVFTRDDQAGIALQCSTGKIDILLGGGREYFLPAANTGLRKDGRDLIAEMQSAGYHYAQNADGLNGVSALPALGLFSADAMAPEIDREVTDQPSLTQEAAKALELLDPSPNGFFLMVEGSLIDHGGHANDLAFDTGDVLAFDSTVGLVLDYQKSHPDTLVIITADHETGGLVLGKGDASFAKLRLVAKQNATNAFIADALVREKDADKFKEQFAAFTGLQLKSAELKTLMAAKDSAALATAISKVVSVRYGVMWSTGDHSAAPVPVMASGPEQMLFSGWYDNTDLPKKIAAAWGLSF